MKAVVIEKFGGPEVMELKEMPRPIPKKNEVLIRVRYAGINPVDWKMRDGLLKDFLPSKFPLILGWDAAGVIESSGDAVYTYCHSGTFAEYIAVDANAVALKPKNSNFKEAAGMPLAALTAWQCLFDFAKIQPRQTVFIQAGAGGVGSFAIQLAKWKGAKVYTTASQKNHAYVKSLGADVAIDYTQEDFTKAMPEKVDAVFDFVGGKVLRQSLPLVKESGCVVSIVNSNVAYLTKARAYYVFVTPNGEQLKEIAALVEDGTIKPVPTKEFLLNDAKEALETMKEGHTQGKLVLKI